jgi:alkyldihydroxyacetonephosphate synthase
MSKKGSKETPATPGVTEDVYTKVKWNGWGSKAAEMKIDANNPLVIIHPNGKPVSALMPFIHAEINGMPGTPKRLEPTPSLTYEEVIQRLPQPVLNDAFVTDMQRVLASTQFKQDAESRLTHIMGKNYRDLWRMRKGMITRAPDAVAFPQSHDDCVKIMQAAQKHNVVIIPFGGQTNVTGCIEPSFFETRRMIVSVDMRRMNRMISIDKESQTAVFECGVLGPDLDELLGRHGFMLGHDPDSYIHSTLGGWIGARGSGAASNAYGDIEDMVIGLKVVTPTGIIETPAVPRAAGVDLNGLIVGSEGIFGIITEATVKIEKIPKARYYEGWFFGTFEEGMQAFKTVLDQGLKPTIMRLYDEDDTRMSFALKNDPSQVEAFVSKAVKQYLVRVKGYDLQKLCLCIMGYEGSQAVADFSRRETSRIFERFNAFRVGQGAGHGWQEKKYDLPYVRDFALGHGLWADVFETVCVYSSALPCWREVKEAVKAVWKAEGKKGWIGCHAAHQYRVGICLYFSYAGQQFDDNDMLTFLKIKKAATDVMLKYRGAPTHHHGIGYEHVPWMARYMGNGALDLLFRIKNEIDPQDICNPAKLLPLRRKPKETDAQYEERCRKGQMFDRVGIPASKL